VIPQNRPCADNNDWKEDPRMTRKPEEATSRRDFLKLAGTAAPAAAVAVATGGAEAQAAEAVVQPDCLQDTAHTRAYYSSARF
jgi:hypothetical protein